MAALYRRCEHALAFGHAGASAVYGGVWLGLLGEKDLREITARWYSEHQQYQAATYDRSGFTPWESDIIERHFAGARRVLLGACGGGRELLALSKSGFAVDAFDCNPDLVACAQRLLPASGCSVHLAAPDAVPPDLGIYDGFIMGWGGYSHILPRAARLRFLRDVRSSLAANAPVLLSFQTRTERGDIKFRVMHRTASVIRRLRLAPPPEFGDALSDIFQHHFSRPEIAEELRECGYELLSYADDFYGHAVARRTSENLASVEQPQATETAPG